MKRRFDGSKVIYEWTPPAENGLSNSILIGTWAEGLEGQGRNFKVITSFTRSERRKSITDFPQFESM